MEIIFRFCNTPIQFQFFVPFHSFDTDENRWEQVQSIPEDSLLHAAVEFNGRIYVLSPLSLFCYDPETDEWTKHEFNEGCYLRKIFNSNHNIFVVTYSCALYWFDPINIIWTKVSFPHCIFGLRLEITVVHGGIVLVLLMRLTPYHRQQR